MPGPKSRASKVTRSSWERRPFILAVSESATGRFSFCLTSLKLKPFFRAAARLIFPHLFFPNQDPLTGTLAAFSAWFIGCIGRPIGATIFGCAVFSLLSAVMMRDHGRQDISAEYDAAQRATASRRPHQSRGAPLWVVSSSYLVDHRHEFWVRLNHFEETENGHG